MCWTDSRFFMMLDLGESKLRKIDEKADRFFCDLCCGGNFPPQRVQNTDLQGVILRHEHEARASWVAMHYT